MGGKIRGEGKRAEEAPAFVGSKLSQETQGKKKTPKYETARKRTWNCGKQRKNARPHLTLLRRGKTGGGPRKKFLRAKIPRGEGHRNGRPGGRRTECL